jgi:hypothetical protein
VPYGEICAYRPLYQDDGLSQCGSDGRSGSLKGGDRSNAGSSEEDEEDADRNHDRDAPMDEGALRTLCGSCLDPEPTLVYE